MKPVPPARGVGPTLERAIALHRAGDLASARRLYEDILRREPGHADALNLSALILTQQGELTVARERAARAVEAVPTAAAYLCTLGQIDAARGDAAAALAAFERALTLDPAHAETHLQKGIVLNATGQCAPACAAFERALALGASGAALHWYHGNALLACGQAGAAIEAYGRALALNPDFVEAYSNRGNALQAIGRPDEAIADFDRALARRPDFADAHCNRSSTLQALGRFEEALASAEQAIRLAPGVSEAHCNRGAALQALGDYPAALAAYDRAIELNPRNAQAHSNRGGTQQQLGDLDGALAAYDRAIALQPTYADAYFNKACALLLRGDYLAGWQLYEARHYKADRRHAQRRSTAPAWTGTEALAGRTVLLYAEQGLGDCLMFARYVPRVAALGAQVRLEAPRALHALLSTLTGGAQLTAPGDDEGACDYQCALMSLPLAFRADAQSLQSSVPYLSADAARVERWRAAIGTAGLRIGINWQGSRSAIDVGRSVPLAALAPLAALPGVRLISLQKHEGLEQLQALPAGMAVETLGPDFDAGPDAFLDTAAVIANLDLVVTSDTSLAHLAGALGAPTWVLLRDVPDWRWRLAGEDCPWYPTARLFRQRRAGDWSGAVAALCAALVSLKNCK